MAVHKKLLAAIVLATIIIVTAPRPSCQETIQVINQLSSNILIVHCASDDDDLDAHAVAINATCAWSFRPIHIGGATLFWCRLAVEDKRLSFVAYDQARRLASNYPDWLVRDDGLHGQRGTFREFIKTWNRI
ncbi:unnamed protein product [Linum tenue]|uniref:S-protein homolog n=1 Tax=Linum tenue TaxID=586396 RepID=A0AAV0IB31_9ROSI|nr:unnamed protein product [Linum tenue]